MNNHNNRITLFGKAETNICLGFCLYKTINPITQNLYVGKERINIIYRTVNQITLTLLAFAIISGFFLVGYIFATNDATIDVLKVTMGYDLVPTIAYIIMAVPRHILKRKIPQFA